MQLKLRTPYEAMIEVEDLPAYFPSTSELQFFDPRSVDFLNELSRQILAHSQLRALPEMVALAFYIRRTNILSIIAENTQPNAKAHLIPAAIGTVFHVCPANVDTMFIYSFAISLLAGNKNILRISERMDAPQIELLFGILNKILEDPEFSFLSHYINIISYGHDDAISSYLSLNCQARVIWGGDNTINIFKQFPTQVRTRDLLFSDRISIACIQAATFNQLTKEEQTALSKKLYNDAYTFDQKGCASPQVLYFIGTQPDCERCENALGRMLSKLVAEQYQTDVSSLASLKLNQAVDDALDNKLLSTSGDNYSFFATLEQGTTLEELHTCGGGYFYIHKVESIADIQTERNNKVQTLAHFGFKEKELEQLKSLAHGQGIDRIVPIGAALDFSYLWDGYNLIDALSKKVFFKP
ncbi:MAG: acyl-CoA reductase [Chitinophagaceae bacterium]